MNITNSNRKLDLRNHTLAATPSKTTLSLNDPLRSAPVSIQAKATCQRYLRNGVAVLSHRRSTPAGSIQTLMFTAIDPNAITTPLIGYYL